MQHRRGAALIIAMIFVIFVVVTATYFISSMGNYRGAGSQKVRFLLADAAADNGKAHAIRVLQEHALEDDRGLLATGLSNAESERQMDLYTSLASLWRREFQADPSLEPGGVFPDIEAVGPPQENVPSKGLTYTHSDWGKLGQFSNIYDDSMLMPYIKVFDQGYAGRGDTRTINRGHGARYFNVAWFDDEFQPVPATDPDSARYKLRYAVQIFDVGGLVKLNFFPETSYHQEDLDRDIPAADLGLDPTVTGEPWGSGNAGDLRREFDMLRDRYAVALYSMFTGGSRRARTYQNWKDSADLVFDRYLHHEPYATMDRDAFMPKATGGAARYPERRPIGWRKIEDVMGKGYQWQQTDDRGLMHYYAADDSGIHPVGGQNFSPKRYLNPGPKSSFELYANLLLKGTSVQSGADKLRYSHVAEGLSRRRGDDVDTQLYWNILTMHNQEVLRLTHNWCSWLQYAWDRDMNTRGKGYATNANNPYSLLPPAEGVPLDRDDNFGVSNADLGYVDGDRMYDKSYDDSGSGYYPMHDVVRYGDIDADGSGEYYVDADPDAPGYRPRFAHDAWYERAFLLRRHFYGLSGAEGKGVSPRMRMILQFSAGNTVGDQLERRKNEGKDGIKTGERWTQSDYLDRGATSSYELSEYAANQYIQSQDYPYMRAPALHDQDGEKILVQDSYSWDIADALNMAIKCTRTAWTGTGNGKADGRTTLGGWQKREDDRARLRDIHAVHRLFLNMLGEDVSTAAPFSGQERPENWIAQPGVIAGRTVTRINPANDTVRGDNNWLVPYVDRNGGLKAIDGHPRMLRIAHGVHTAGMERLLNDVRVAFFGASYVDENGDTQPIPPLDFNGDGFAESSLTGFNDGLVEKPGSYVHGVSQPRPYSDQASDAGNPYHPFLAAAPGMPLKPFTAAGRLFMGKSHYYRVSVRGQLWDLVTEEKSAERTLDFIYCVNPSDHPATIELEGPLDDNGTPDLTDSHVVFQRTLINQARDGQGGN